MSELYFSMALRQRLTIINLSQLILSRAIPKVDGWKNHIGPLNHNAPKYLTVAQNKPAASKLIKILNAESVTIPCHLAMLLIQCVLIIISPVFPIAHTPQPDYYRNQ
jgi:hypothetical protein